MSPAGIRRQVRGRIARGTGKHNRPNQKANRQHPQAQPPNFAGSHVAGESHASGFTSRACRPVWTCGARGRNLHDSLFCGFQNRFGLDARTTAQQVALTTPQYSGGAYDNQESPLLIVSVHLSRLSGRRISALGPHFSGIRPALDSHWSDSGVGFHWRFAPFQLVAPLAGKAGTTKTCREA